MIKELFSTNALVEGGRDGRAKTADGFLDVALAFPPALGGSGDGTNPEALFAAGFAGCFASSIRFAAQQMQLDAGQVSVDASVTLTVDPEGRYGLKVALSPQIPAIPPEDRPRVIAEAKRICAYTNATLGHVNLTIAA